MTFQLSRIVLFPYGDRDPRVLPLELNALNIITGDSGTGKSAIIDIVDYCLASGECRVADGVIRDNVAWYAVELVVPGSRVFVARRGPETGSPASNDVCVLYDQEDLPAAASLEPVTNVAGLEGLLTELAGISRTADPDGRLAPTYSATIRHASRLLFQSQNEISSNTLLFHGQSDDFVKASIRDTLPFFLGAVDADDLATARRMADRRRELRRVQQQVRELENLADVEGSRLSRLFLEGVDLGVIEHVAAESGARSEVIAALRAVTLEEVGEREIDVAGVTDRIGERRRALREQMRSLRDAYQLTQEQLTETRDFYDVRSSFDAAATDQLERLRLGAELPGSAEALHECPLCSSELDQNLPTHADVLASLRSLEQTVAAFSQDPPQLRALAEDLTGRANDLRRQMVNARGQLESLDLEAARLQESFDQRDQRMLWYGRVSLFLESVAEESQLVDLRLRVSRLQVEIQELESRVGSAAVRDRMASIVSRLSQAMTASAAPLNLEWSNYPIRFDARELTVVVDGPSGPIPLRRVGSGEAWVAYHMVTHLALHQQYASAGRPVPRMLFLDQPSQVYFPRESDAATVAPDRIGDMAAAERLLRVAYSATQGDAGFQVIMTEHAEIDEDWFRASLVEDWRDGRALIPQEWL
ncbi:DUF3732 domain-containing protein [Kribbella sp. CA-245084]|uniref:DUF3732 domain-containing protein n=1 Tax=Kribbella sp. CA-245084 TaxID=3239940 RepID=UPI003D9138EA